MRPLSAGLCVAERGRRDKSDDDLFLLRRPSRCRTHASVAWPIAARDLHRVQRRLPRCSPRARRSPSTPRTITTRSSPTRGSTGGRTSRTAPRLRDGQRLRGVRREDVHQLPPFPAVLMLPLVKLAGSAGELPRRSVHHLARGARAGVSLPRPREAPAPDARGEVRPRTERENLGARAALRVRHRLLLHGVEGTVWFAAQVVGTAVSALYVLFALDAEQPLARGRHARLRVRDPPHDAARGAALRARGRPRPAKDGLTAGRGRVDERLRATWARLDKPAFEALRALRAPDPARLRRRIVAQPPPLRDLEPDASATST